MKVKLLRRMSEITNIKIFKTMKYLYFVTGKVYYKTIIPESNTHNSLARISSADFKVLIEIEEKSRRAIYDALKNELTQNKRIGTYDHAAIGTITTL